MLVVYIERGLNGSSLQMMDEEGVQSDSGFIWNAAGHVVTNDP
jgi:hypothetical protein